MRKTFLLAVLGLGSPCALAQEAMYTDAATMPSPNTFILREQFHYFRFGTDPNSEAKSTDLYQAQTALSYGLVRDWSLTLMAPVEFRHDQLKEGGSDNDYGVSDLDLSFKWRFYKNDSGGINTIRAALIGGAEFASGDDHDFSSQTINPHIGGVITLVRGRHGFNQDVHFQVNTGGDDDHNFGGDGSADVLRYNSAYVYRIYPSAYTADSIGAWYVTAEVNGISETNADHELRFSPGLMYEGRRWAFEVMGQLPLFDELDHRPELDFAVGMGVRISF